MTTDRRYSIPAPPSTVEQLSIAKGSAEAAKADLDAACEDSARATRILVAALFALTIVVCAAIVKNPIF